MHAHPYLKASPEEMSNLKVILPAKTKRIVFDPRQASLCPIDDDDFVKALRWTDANPAVSLQIHIGPRVVTLRQFYRQIKGR